MEGLLASLAPGTAHSITQRADVKKEGGFGTQQMLRWNARAVQTNRGLGLHFVLELCA